MTATELIEHLAELVDSLPEPDLAAVPGQFSLCERQVFDTVLRFPGIAAEAALREHCPVDRLQWTIALRHLRRHGCLAVHTARAGGRLLAPTTAGRTRHAPSASPTTFERLLAEFGAFAELVGDVHANLAPAAERWLERAGVFDAMVVRGGRGVATVAVHPLRPRPRWAVVLDAAMAAGASVLLLQSWPEHHAELARATELAGAELAGHGARLSLVLETGFVGGEVEPV
ncbi:hypothetical protein M8C13_38630 [Crossiella sp. SN42]|uniref:hypothetical protein n=1 Tax=Crossiella sp. SN42 TaxID=2944808 RepID=UPI00207C44E6|nr:hypothetical protein [Crossiella sp. SN42]MCO1581682.1 hypothetical protein [Crossiella sp. SN42]